jgi:hypothetical protein
MTSAQSWQRSVWLRRWMHPIVEVTAYSGTVIMLTAGTGTTLRSTSPR